MAKKKLYERYARYIGGRSYERKVGIFKKTEYIPVNDGNVLLLQSGYLLLQGATNKLLLNT